MKLDIFPPTSKLEYTYTEHNALLKRVKNHCKNAVRRAPAAAAKNVFLRSRETRRSASLDQK